MNMKAQEALNIMRNNPVFWSRLGFCYDPPMLNENQEPIVFSTDFKKTYAYHEAFKNAGVKIHTCVLHSGWIGIDKYDYSLTDKVLDTILKDGSIEYFIPRIKLNVPIEWCKENPEDVYVYYEGPRDAEGIRSLAGTLKQDILGYDSKIGYYNADGWKDSRPNVGGVISLQSFSSEKWLKDAGEALKRLIIHIESGPYKDRILAYHIAYGACGESMFWGRASDKFGDYGINNRKAFLKWGLNKYKTQESLKNAWGEIENDILPKPCLREKNVETLKDFFKEDGTDTLSIDYDRFSSEVNANAIMHFGKIVKEHSGDKAVGAFYGYIIHVTRSAYTGYLGWDILLNSPYVDFFAAPKSYFRSSPGEPGGEMCPAQSVNLKKLWVDECDNRTHLVRNDACGGVAQNFNETRSVIWREFSKNLSHNSGYWWMDLGGGWYNDETIMAEIKKVVSLNSRLRREKCESISEILVVADDNSIYYTAMQFNQFILEDTLRNIQLIGAPVDIFRMSDLVNLDLSKYKLIIFLNAFYLQEGARESLKKIFPKNVTVLWNYASGICAPNFDVNNVKKLTGFNIDMYSKAKKLEHYPDTLPPQIEIKQEDNIQIYKKEDGRIKAAMKNCEYGNSALNTMLPIDSGILRSIAEDCGCHMYAPLNCSVYADNRFISVFPKETVKGYLKLKEKREVTEIIRGDNYGIVNSAEVNMQGKEAYFFMLQDI